MGLDTIIAETLMAMLEGGAATGGARIPRERVATTIKKFEEIILSKIPHTFAKPVGSTGKKASSGDIDLAVETDMDLEGIAAIVQQAGYQFKVSKGLDEVHVLFPQFNPDGSESGDFVQVDIMRGQGKWLEFTRYGPSDTESKYKGVHRYALMIAMLRIASEQKSGADTTYTTISPTKGFFRKKGQMVKNKKGVETFKSEPTGEPHIQDPQHVADVVSQFTGKQWTVDDFNKPFETIWKKAKASFKPDAIQRVRAEVEQFLTNSKLPIPQELSEAGHLAYNKKPNGLGHSKGGQGSQGNVGGPRNRGVPGYPVPQRLSSKVSGNGFDIQEAVDPSELEHGIPHIDDLKPEEFMNFLKKYSGMKLHGGIEISEKVDGSARISFGPSNGGIWTQSKSGKRMEQADQYPDAPMFRALKRAHQALERSTQQITSNWPQGVTFMVAEVLYTRIPNSIEYGPNVLMIHGVESEQGPLDDVKAKKAAEQVTRACGGQLSDGKEPWKFEYKRTINPEEVMVDVRKEFDSLGEIYQELAKAPRDKNLRSKFQTIQKQVKEKLIGQLRKQKSAYGPEGGDVEGIVFRDLESGQMVKLVDKDYFTALNNFLWHWRKMLDAGVGAGKDKKHGVMGHFRKVVAEKVLGDPAAASTQLVKNLMSVSEDVAGKTPEERADKVIAKYITQRNLMKGDFATEFQGALMGAFDDLDRLRNQWEEFKSNPQSMEFGGKKRQFPPEHIERTEESFQWAEAALKGIKAGMEVAGGIKHPLTQRVALFKLFMGHKFNKLVSALGGGGDDTMEEGIGSWTRGIAASALLGAPGSMASDDARRMEMPPAVTQKAPDVKTRDQIIATAAAKHGVPERLLRAMIEVESEGNPKAVSSKGARGLMQLMPATAKSVGVKNIEDPEENINGGAAYLRKLINTFRGNLDRVLAAYNAGPNRVATTPKAKLPQETKDYIRKVRAKLGKKPLKLESVFSSDDKVKSSDDKWDSQDADSGIDSFRRSILNSINSIVNKLRPRLEKRVGAKIGKHLGVGSTAAVFDLGDRVLKITSDESDARACHHVKGKDFKHVVNVYDTFKLPIVEDEFGSDGQFFGVVAEKLQPLDHEDKQLIRPAMGLLNMMSGQPWAQVKQALETGQAGFLKYYDVQDIGKMYDAINAFRLDEMLDELASFEYSSGDFHDENLMKRADGTVVLSDMGYSSSMADKTPGMIEKKVDEGGPIDRMTGPTDLSGVPIKPENPNTLETVVYESVMKLLKEAQQGTIGVTIGRFQPFHAGHAAIIRDLTKRFTNVVVFVAGQKQDKKNPFSHDLRLQMMEKSLPDVWSKIKVFPATIQGKGTGYVPGLIANAMASGEAGIQDSGAVDVLVGEDRLVDIQKQVQHNAEHQGEPGYYKGTVTVSALPGVKNDDDTDRISGTRVREALVKGDEQAVMKMLDTHLAQSPEAHGIYTQLREQMKVQGLLGKVMEAIIAEMTPGMDNGHGFSRGGSWGSSGWSRAILAKDMTGDEIYNQMLRSPSTRMLPLNNPGQPNTDMPGIDSLDQRPDDEQDPSKPTDLGEMVYNTFKMILEKDFPRAKGTTVPVAPELKWNPWTFDKSLAPRFNDKFAPTADGETKKEVGPGEVWLTMEPTAPTYKGEVQGKGTHYDIDKDGVHYEVKGVSDHGVFNVSGMARGHMEDIIADAVTLKRQFRKLLDEYNKANSADKSALENLVRQGMDLKGLKDYLDVVDQGGYFMDFTLGHRESLVKNIENIAQFNKSLPPKMQFTHPWIMDPKRFWIDVSTLDFQNLFSEAPGGVILVDQDQGWFHIPVEAAEDWFEFYGMSRGDLQLKMKKMPYGPRAQAKQEKEKSRADAKAKQAQIDAEKKAEKQRTEDAKKAADERFKQWCIDNKITLPKDLRKSRTDREKKLIGKGQPVPWQDQPEAQPTPEPQNGTVDPGSTPQ